MSEWVVLRCPTCRRSARYYVFNMVHVCKHCGQVLIYVPEEPRPGRKPGKRKS